MKKLFQKKKDNKGFSLVELIVVVAIMAVLMGVLVPTLVRNVEKSKHQKDLNAISEVANAIQQVMADAKFSTATGTVTITGDTISFPKAGGYGLTGFPSGTTEADFWNEVVKNLDGEQASSFSTTYTSKLAHDNTSTVFVLGNEKVNAAVTGGGSKYTSQENVVGTVTSSGSSSSSTNATT